MNPGRVVTALGVAGRFECASARAETPPPAPPAPAAPCAFADVSWVPGGAGASERPLSFGPFTGELRIDDAYPYSFSDPQDGSLVDSSEVFRHGEFQLTQLGFGGDVQDQNVQGRLMTQFGLYAESNHRAANVAFFAGRGG